MRLREDQELFLLPDILLENFKRIFREFGLSEKEINKIHIFMDFKDELGVDGYYLGEKGNKHFVQLDSRLLNNGNELNLTIIHELRHLYWNVVEPKKIARCGEYGTLLSRFPKGGRLRKTRSDKENNDCYIVEKIYSHIVLLEPFYVDQILDNFFNPHRQLSLPFFTL